jgi:crotonobetainyl-CoA:carnitine CoA-transferase CaiB-like acyl-CoA transferase
MLVELAQPGDSGRPVTVAGQPLKFAGTPTAVGQRAPTLGEENVDAIIAAWSTSTVES